MGVREFTVSLAIVSIFGPHPCKSGNPFGQAWMPIDNRGHDSQGYTTRESVNINMLYNPA
jgi:hypothetical protein